MSVESSSSTVTVRRVRERMSPLPWWPGGIVPLLLLGLLGLFLFGWFPSIVERAVTQDVTETLRSAGHDWAEVSVSGQHVVIRGHAPSEAVGAQAVALAEDARSDTWTGRLVSPWKVLGEFDEEPAPVAATPLPPVAWGIRRTENALRLTGRVADDPAREAIVAAAQAMASRVGLADVIDELEVGGGGPGGSAEVGAYGVSVLEDCATGAVTVEAGRLGLACEVERAAQVATVEGRLESLPDPLQRGKISVLHREQADDCDEALATLLQSRIRFASARADVQSRSFGLLDQIAQTAAACPGTLRIEGHTDATGQEPFNQTLSENRAEAVKQALVERGVDAGRLSTVGFGSARPVDTNETRRGRAANRRIEISVVRPGDL